MDKYVCVVSKDNGVFNVQWTKWYLAEGGTNDVIKEATKHVNGTIAMVTQDVIRNVKNWDLGVTLCGLVTQEILDDVIQIADIENIEAQKKEIAMKNGTNYLMILKNGRGVFHAHTVYVGQKAEGYLRILARTHLGGEECRRVSQEVLLNNYEWYLTDTAIYSTGTKEDAEIFEEMVRRENMDNFRKEPTEELFWAHVERIPQEGDPDYYKFGSLEFGYGLWNGYPDFEKYTTQEGIYTFEEFLPIIMKHI